jgi:hypothetical protein
VHQHDNNNCVVNFQQKADCSRYLQEEASSVGEECIENFQELTDGSGGNEKNRDKGNEDQQDVESFMYRREEQMTRECKASITGLKEKIKNCRKCFLLVK